MNPSDRSGRSLAERSALILTSVTVIVSVAWIVLSDRIVGQFAANGAQTTQLQSYKGVAYVLTIGLVIYAISSRLYRSLEKERQRESEAAFGLISRLAIAVELRDSDSRKHIDRMATMVHAVAKSYGFTEQRALQLSQASLLHDVGKICLPDAILLKPGPLTADERIRMQEHVSIGESILRDSDEPVIRLGATVARTHHENWDGSGYPDGLKGAQIPVEGRIVAICDVFDALVSHRAYKRAWSFEEAVEEIRNQSEVKFDPQVVIAFENTLDKLREIVASGLAGEPIETPFEYALGGSSQSVR